LDSRAGIERNVEALKRILVSLVAMAGFAATFTSPLWGGRSEASGGGNSQPDTPTPNPSPQGGGELRPTLPRHLHRAILRLLRPAESAARRLIIAMAMTATPEARETGHGATPLGNGDAITVPRWRGPVQQVEVRSKRHFRPTSPRQPDALPAPRRLSLPLLDPMTRPFRSAAPVRPTTLPRLWAPGMTAPRFPLPAPPAPHDPLDATRLRLRLDALGRALDDLPRQALRFARWQARQASLRERGRFRHPLRPGRPPGALPPGNRRHEHEVHAVLAHAHSLGWWALERRNTS
jgi:hypothetical protein